MPNKPKKIEEKDVITVRDVYLAEAIRDSTLQEIIKLVEESPATCACGNKDNKVRSTDVNINKSTLLTKLKEI